MTNNLDQLAKKFIEGTWLYDTNNKILKKPFASSEELSTLELIDKEGFLSAPLKAAITQALDGVLSNDVVGPFGDSDIFSGDILDDGILYNLELHEVSDATLETLQQIPNVTIKS
jgi:hypothetical protein